MIDHRCNKLLLHSYGTLGCKCERTPKQTRTVTFVKNDTERKIYSGAKMTESATKLHRFSHFYVENQYLVNNNIWTQDVWM